MTNNYSDSVPAKKLLYISGPMRGIPEHNHPAFNDAARKLRDVGYTVMNPADWPPHEGWEWKDYLRRDLSMMLAAGNSLHGLATLPELNPQQPSKGRALEIALAQAFGLPVLFVEYWIVSAYEAGARK